MDFREYQTTSRDFVKCPADIGIFFHTLGVMNGSGELAGKINNALIDHQGQMTKEKALKIGISLGDILYNCVQLATDLGLSLDEIITLNLKKLMMEEKKQIQEENKRPIKQ